MDGLQLDWFSEVCRVVFIVSDFESGTEYGLKNHSCNSRKYIYNDHFDCKIGRKSLKGSN